MSTITAKTKICMIIGDPVEHSLSPAMHNKAYQKQGLDFVFIGAKVTNQDLPKAIDGIRSLGIRGTSVTIPHKVEVMQYLDKVDDRAQKIGAINTIVNDNGYLTGYNTDYLGTVTPLEEMLNKAGKQLKDQKVVLLGAGGAARAMAFGVLSREASLTICNRTLSKAEALAQELGCKAAELDATELIKQADIIINSTSLGMGEQVELSPISQELISSEQIIFDAVYIPYETKLIKDAKAKGAKVIHGIDMLLYQGIAQYRLYTRQDAPIEVMREALHQHFNLDINQ